MASQTFKSVEEARSAVATAENAVKHNILQIKNAGGQPYYTRMFTEALNSAQKRLDVARDELNALLAPAGIQAAIVETPTFETIQTQVEAYRFASLADAKRFARIMLGAKDSDYHTVGHWAAYQDSAVGELWLQRDGVYPRLSEFWGIHFRAHADYSTRR